MVSIIPELHENWSSFLTFGNSMCNEQSNHRPLQRTVSLIMVHAATNWATVAPRDLMLSVSIRLILAKDKGSDIGKKSIIWYISLNYEMGFWQSSSVECPQSVHRSREYDPYRHSFPGRTWTAPQGSWVHPPPVGHTETHIRHHRLSIITIILNKWSAEWHAKQLSSVERVRCKHGLKILSPCLLKLQYVVSL